MFLIGLVRRLVVLAAILAIPVIAGEFIVRKLVGDAVASALRSRIGVAAHVNLGSGPVLLELAKGRLNGVTVSARRARIAGLPPATLTATLNDVHLTNVTSLEGAIGSLRVDARVGSAGVGELLASPSCTDALPADLRSALTATPRVLLFPGRIDLLAPSGRRTEVRLRPLARPSGLAFAVIGIERAGVASPVNAVSAPVLCVRALASLRSARRSSRSRPTGRSTSGCAPPARRSRPWGSPTPLAWMGAVKAAQELAPARRRRPRALPHASLALACAR